jgi:hypothetical protein
LAHQKLVEKYPGLFAMCFMRRMGKIIWTDHVKTEEVLHRAKNERNNIYTIQRRNVYLIVISWVGTAFKNSLLKER